MLKFSDFEKSISGGNKKCRHCANCKIGITGYEFARCMAMYLSSGGYIQAPKETHTGFSCKNGAYISLLIQNGDFPNSAGDCIYYKPKWYKKLFGGK